MNNILIVGAGYVGLTTAAGLSSLGHNVICVDKDKYKINLLNDNKMPIYEPGLIEIINKNIELNLLKFTTSIKPAIDKSDIIFIAVGTPENKDGSVDLKYLYKSIDEILSYINKDIIIIIKSTVPVNTNHNILKICEKKSSFNIDIISNPEFLREGLAVNDFYNPERIIVGINNIKNKIIINEIYSDFIKRNIPIIYTDPNSAEISKYASNAFLATKISFINEIANICEFYGGDIDDVAKMMGMDRRIASEFLKVGPGFGGSCFPKDILALENLAVKADISNNIISSVVRSNNDRIKLMAYKIKSILGNVNKNLSILGVSFKANTDDVRSSPAITIIEELLKHGYIINLYDPAALKNAKKILKNKVNYHKNIISASESVHAIIILTEWKEFKDFDFKILKPIMKSNILVDFRNILDGNLVRAIGFDYYCLGKNNI